MKREYFAMLFILASIILIFTAGFFFGDEVVFANVSRYIVIWLLVAFYAGQHSMKFPKAF